MYTNLNNPVNYQLQGFGQNGVRTISTDQLYIQGEYYRVLVAEEDSYVTAVSVLGDDLTAEFVYAGTTIYGLFTEVSVSSGSLTAYIAGPTDIEDVWAYINAYGQTNAARIEAADCAKDAIAPLLDKYYAKASLVMVPSLYKTSIVYSERPLTTDGQLAFTRSNDTATRVGPDGYIEKVRTNLAINSAWAGVGTGVPPTSWSTFDPNFSAGPSAGQIRFNTTANRGYIFQSFTVAAGDYTQSVFVDSVTTTESVGSILTVTGVTATNSVFYEDGVVVSAGENIKAGKRYARKLTLTAGTANVRFGSGVNGAVTADWVGSRPQFEVGDIATDYIPTTASAVSVGPVANLPRLNYPINSDGSVGCPSLLLEPQRTNLVTYSENFDNAAWTKQTGITITANTTETLDPSGYYGADKIVSTSGSTGFFQAGLSLTSDIVRSIYLKGAVGGEEVKIKDPSGFGGSTTYTLTTSWVRYEHKTTNTGDTYQGLFVDDITNGATIYAWGAQLEAGAYATSYIPTLGASVTRGADACSKQNIAGTLPTAYPFTLYAEGFLRENNDMLLSINDIAASDVYYQIGATASGFIASARNTAGSSASTSSGRSVGTHKVAAVFTSSEIRLFANGALIATAANAQTFNTNANDVLLGQLRVASDFGLRSSVNQALVFKSALTDSEVIELTTL